ncbi:mitogen-activated protein kinase kinase kinase [Malassezia yamatoensis]|uniref:Mitogen-activated protein kinase kinase kinase n=1 Tax=Malassezia yamatoensis TaxID=253288 RepID=A0AAJ5YYQ3_9BASI|nr:mitogen-activated protein kinase kinase kinase [Malassezia yamatoensis]
MVDAGGANTSRHGGPCHNPGDRLDRSNYFGRIRTSRSKPVETPFQMSTPQAEQGLLDHMAFDDDPSKRVEWQMMLRSVLESEVLSSETKRISSADTSVRAPNELMNEIWLKLRAARYGNDQGRNNFDMDRKVLQEVQMNVVPKLIQEIIQAREFPNQDAQSSSQSNVNASEASRQGTQSVPSHVPNSSDDRQSVMLEVQQLLNRVDIAESLFPSQRQMLAEYPAWGSVAVQQKLSALYAWYNVTRSLQAQAVVLAKWTGSLTGPGGIVNVTGHFGTASGPSPSPNTNNVNTNQANPSGPPITDSKADTLVEDIFRESNLQQTFERRTLYALNQMVLKAKEAMAKYHSQFHAMRLPSFEPDVLPLIRFPMWLAEGALRQRLEYADKLKEPSVLLVDSLSDDLRTAIALACRLKEQYSETTVSDPERGWDLPLETEETFNATVCSALLFFFRLLHFRLKSVTFFKEVDLLEPEWDFLCSAVRVIPGGDAIVAHKTAYMVNRLFVRIIAYFQRELQAPTTELAGQGASHPKTSARPSPLKTHAPSSGGRLTEGKVSMTIPEMVRWVHTVFNTERVRNRKLIGFARKVRARLENAAEFDLRSLKPPLDTAINPASVGTPVAQHDLHSFLQTLLQADYFLVYTTSFEERGVYVLAEPTLHDQPQTIQELMFTCIRGIRPSRSTHTHDDELQPDTPSTRARHRTRFSPHYLLLLSPREPFLWTGRVMTLPMPWVNVNLKEQRLRLVADGTREKLQYCKNHLQWQFVDASARPSDFGAPPPSSPFPLTTVYEQMAHLSRIQHELKLMNKGAYVLTDTVLQAVPAIRQHIDTIRQPIIDEVQDSTNAERLAERRAERAMCDELVQTCFSIAVDQGARALAYLESQRLRSQISATLAQLAIEWISFICDDCVLTEHKTFRWAVAALENAMQMTRSERIFLLSENEFTRLKSKVSACVALLISHFDILGARSTAAQAEEQQKRFERDKLLHARNIEKQIVEYSDDMVEKESLRRLQSLALHDNLHQERLNDRRAVGRVLDDTRLEDRNLQLLASKGVQMRWQQGRFIGGGTFGTVYLAVNLDTGGLMAVKEIRFQELSTTPSLYKQIHDEMNVMEMLRHPNIVEYYGIEVHRDKVYIFEEYCQGGSLAQLLEHGRIEDEIVLQVYTLQMLDGLMYLHSQGVVHRDIKPENILLDHMGVIKFVDFGAAKVLSANPRTVQRSSKPHGPLIGNGNNPGIDAAGHSLQGTPMYMSPEVIKGNYEGPQGAMDIWSLGCVVLECATGSRPWAHLDNEWAIMFHIGMAQQHPPLPDPSQLSQLGIDFIEKCLTIDPQTRPSAVEMRSDPWIHGLVDELEENGELDVLEPNASEAAEQLAEAYVEEQPTQPASPPLVPVRPIHPERFRQEHYANAAAAMRASRQSYVAHESADGSARNDQEHRDLSPAKTPSSPRTSAATAYSAQTHTVPGHPDHRHPGYEAIIADQQYRREEEQTKAMLEPDTNYL